MKNFDLDQLEKKNIYKVPDDFFLKVQDEVIAKNTRQAPVVPLKPVTRTPGWVAIAASLALLLGLTLFYFNNNKEGQNTNIATTSVKENTAETEPSAANTVVADAQASELQETIAVAPQANLTPAEKANPTVRNSRTESQPAAVNVRPDLERPVVVKSEVAFASNENEIEDAVLTSLSKDELADLSKNTDSDVYLDLYY